MVSCIFRRDYSSVWLHPELVVYFEEYRCVWAQIKVAVVLNNTALTTSTRSNPGLLVPCGSEHEGTISFSQPLITNLTNTILSFVLFLVMSSIVLIVCALF